MPHWLIVITLIGAHGTMVVGWAMVRFPPLRRKSLRWPTVEGKVVHASHEMLFPFLPEGNAEVFRLTYEYRVRGVIFVCGRVHWFGGGFVQWFARETGAQDYPEGKAVTVHYDPVNPRKAVLHPRSPHAVNQLMLFVSVTTILLIVMFVLGAAVYVPRS